MLRSADDIRRWAETARPGDQAAYGRGSTPPRELVQAMAGLVEAGALVPVRKREGGEFLFLLQRGSAANCRDAAGQRRRVSRGGVRSGRFPKAGTSAVMALLADCARRGRPCPTNEEIAAICGLSGRLAASYRIQLLARQGRIAVESHGPLMRRVVTILKGRSAGLQTAEAPM